MAARGGQQQSAALTSRSNEEDAGVGQPLHGPPREGLDPKHAIRRHNDVDALLRGQAAGAGREEKQSAKGACRQANRKARQRWRRRPPAWHASRRPHLSAEVVAFDGGAAVNDSAWVIRLAGGDVQLRRGSVGSRLSRRQQDQSCSCTAAPGEHSTFSCRRTQLPGLQCTQGSAGRRWRTCQLSPATPLPLLPTAPRMPATIVPWPKVSAAAAAAATRVWRNGLQRGACRDCWRAAGHACQLSDICARAEHGGRPAPQPAPRPPS